MATKLFVGSLSWDTTDDQLKEFFSAAGTVTSASVITDRNTNRSKGFGFVEMSTDAEAQEAIKQLNGKDLDGRSINVSEAKPREDAPRNSFGGGQGGGNNRNRSQGGYQGRRY
jgi:cold-inducible RNA-binding protein